MKHLLSILIFLSFMSVVSAEETTNNCELVSNVEKSDFKYLLKYKQCNPYFDPRLDIRYALLFNSHFSKPLKLDLLYKPMSVAYNLRETLSGFRKSFLLNSRYLIISGCRYQSCPEKGLVWIDLIEEKVVGVIIHHRGFGKSYTSPNLLIFTNNFESYTDLPILFWKHLFEAANKDNISDNFFFDKIIMDKFRFIGNKNNFVQISDENIFLNK